MTDECTGKMQSGMLAVNRENTFATEIRRLNITGNVSLKAQSMVHRMNCIVSEGPLNK